MYRAPDTTPRCLACGNSNLTPDTRFDPSEHSQIHFADSTGKPTFLGSPNYRSFTVNRARVCLDCGHVALSLGGRRLAELRGALATLKPLPD